MRANQPERIKRRLFIAPLLAISSFAAVALLHSYAAGAQQAALNVSPAILDIPLQPGQSSTREITIQNTTDLTLPMTVDVTSALINAEPLNQSFENRYNVSQWIQLSADSFVLEPGATETLRVTVESPGNAESGGHYAQIIIRALVLEQANEADVSTLIFPEVTVPLLISVGGDVESDYAIPRQNYFPLFVQPNQPLETQFQVQNFGNIHNLVRPQIVLYKSGEEVQRLTLEPAIVLPQTARTFSLSWEWPSEYGLYEAQIEVPVVNAEEIVMTNSEDVYAIIPIRNLLLLAIGVWTALFLFLHRKNVTQALHALLHPSG